MINSISFGNRTEYLYGKGETQKDKRKDLERELKPACIARRAGVDAINYKAIPSKGVVGVKYDIAGKAADLNNNPITKKHIENLLESLYQMDKIGFYHTCLTPDHLFYGENGRVQIASMKNVETFQKTGKNFTLRERNQPDFVMPSNADRYELQSLSLYISKMDDGERREFLRTYLNEKSDYHQKRAELLLSRGESPNSKTVKFEKAKAAAFKNPSDKVLNFVEDKFELGKMQRTAAKMWHDGAKPKDGKLYPEKRFASVVLMLDCLEKAVELRDRAKILSSDTENRDIKNYFALEKECMQLLASNILEDTKTGGADNFHNKGYGGKLGLFLGSKQDEEIFNDKINGINMKNSAPDICKEINDLARYYTELADNWNPEQNSIFKNERLLRPVEV